MGGGGSRHYRTHAEAEAERQRREWVNERRRKRKAAEKARKDALRKERDAWLKNNKRRLAKKWWNVGWWPLYECKYSARDPPFFISLRCFVNVSQNLDVTQRLLIRAIAKSRYLGWKERAAWEQELHRRRMEGLIDSEGFPLRSQQD
jgi:hypothetical protein